MVDLKSQIRDYYVATTSPTDVDAVMADFDLTLEMDADDRLGGTDRWGPEPGSRARVPSKWAGVRLGVAAFAAIFLAGLLFVFGSGGFDGDEPLDPASSELSEVLFEYESAFNDGDLEAIMRLYADDAVIVGHPKDPDGTTSGRQQIRIVEQRQLAAPGYDEPIRFVDIIVAPGSVEFGHEVMLSPPYNPVCVSGAGHVMAIEDGKISRWEWGSFNQLCEPPLNTPAGVLGQYVDAYNSGDIDRLLGLFAPQPEMDDHPFADALGGVNASAAGVHRDSAAPADPYRIESSQTEQNTVTFDDIWISGTGETWCGNGHEVTVEYGQIVSWLYSQPEPCG